MWDWDNPFLWGDLTAPGSIAAGPPPPGAPADPLIGGGGTVSPPFTPPPSPVSPPIAPPQPTPPISPPTTAPPTPSGSSPPTQPPPPPQSPPPSSGPSVRIWEDPAEWTGERRTQPRIPQPRTPAPVFEGEYTVPRGVWPIVGGIVGRALGGIAGIFWPSELGNSELTPEQIAEGRERYAASEEAKADALRGEILEQRIRELEAARASQWPGRYHRPQVEGTAGGLLEQPVPQPVITPRPVPVPVPELTPPSPAIHAPPSPATSTSTRTSSPPRPSRARVPTPQPTLGQELLDALLSGLLSGASTWARNRARTIAQEAFSLPNPSPSTPGFVDPLTPPRPVGVVDPLTPPRGNPLTSFNPSLLGSSPPSTPTRSRTDRDRCRCKPKKRKKPRKCHAKAGLRWVGGPKSGQLAGSRCYAFTNGD